MDRTTTVRASVHDIEITLLISIVLVILVVFVFLRTVRATIIPSIAVPLSLIGTFGVMYLLALQPGQFVIDGTRNFNRIRGGRRHRRSGKHHPLSRTRHAAKPRRHFVGAREIGFTVLSMSTSLIAVFIPILMMGGIVGRLFREFAVTLSIAIAVSLLVSLTTTPTMCAQLLKATKGEKHGRAYQWSQKLFDGMQSIYLRGLGWVLRHQPVMLVVTVLTAGLTVYLYVIVPKGFFPQQDTGRIAGSVQAAQDISFPAMSAKMTQFVNIVMKDPAVDTIVGFAGGSTALNQGRMFIMLKPLNQRKISADLVIARLAAEAGGGSGRHVIYAVVAGFDDWRKAEPGAISIHAPG